MSRVVSSVDLAEAGQRLDEARVIRRPCPPVRDLLPAGDVVAAYAVQSAFVAERIAGGARLVGRKIGLTNPAVQRQLGVDQPDYGTLFDDMDCSATGVIPMDRVLQPRIEAEIAFVLGHDLVGDRVGPDDVVAATDHVVAAFEIVDSRVAGWDITIVDTIADNASAGLFVLGGDPRDLDGIELRECQMTMRRGAEVVSAGRGSDCLGDPLAAVAWLAETMSSLGSPLRAGEIVLSGALGPVVPARARDGFVADITGLGHVTAQFGPDVP